MDVLWKGQEWRLKWEGVADSDAEKMERVITRSGNRDNNRAGGGLGTEPTGVQAKDRR